MITICRDLGILAAICLACGLLVQIRAHNRQVERNRAELLYTVDVDDDTARVLLASLEELGFLNGIPRTFWLGKTGDIYELRVVTNPAVIANPRIEEALRTGFRAVCQRTFPAEQAMVKLANSQLETFSLLVEPQRF